MITQPQTAAKTIPKVVVIGGGTGSFVVLSGLKQFAIDLTAIVTVADSGGSTGRLRDEFGFVPVGDLRQALAALATVNESTWIKDILLYRFSKGSGLEGHNLGNLILTALQDMTGSTAKAVEITEKIFKLEGEIYPITTKDIQLVIEYEDGTVEIGEHILDEAKHGGKKIVALKTSPRAQIYSKAKQAILAADYIIIGPGDLYGSILPNLIVEGTKQAIRQSSAQKIYISNLMTRFSQTHKLTSSEHIDIVEKYMGTSCDVVIINNTPIPVEILNAYKIEQEFPLVDDVSKRGQTRILKAPLIRTAMASAAKGDALRRSFLRHSPQRLAKLIYNQIISPNFPS